ncbi:hypothetical protein BJ741DRAFT_296320 [Chytriomyces cf. hyalinus JEL632]|nr:hypothetical protein BJ741DRAFT_296320 [Chytriomyces cf. hyalinus JEL632]
MLGLSSAFRTSCLAAAWPRPMSIFKNRLLFPTKQLSTIATPISSAKPGMPRKSFVNSNSPNEDAARNKSPSRALLLGSLLVGLATFPTAICILAPANLTDKLPYIVAGVETVSVAGGYLAFGFILPFVPSFVGGLFLPFGIVLSALNDLRCSNEFDHERWELLDNDSAGRYTVTWKNDSLSWKNSATERNIVGAQDVSFFKGVGKAVEKEWARQRRGSPSGNIVVLKGKETGTFGKLIGLVEIPIHLDWVHEKV